MFKKLIDSLKNRTESFTPSDIDDPIAQQTQWGPAKGGGTNFRTHHLVKVDANRVAFKPTIGVLLFGGLFMLIGIGVFIGLMIAVSSGNFDGPTWGGILFGSVFLLAFGGGGFWILRSSSKPRVFDARAGWYWCSRESIELASRNDEDHKKGVPLDEIHAVQIIREYCRSDKSSYYSYELNLVLTNADRVNVVDHGNRRKLVRDAEKLSEFLDIPLWDAT